MDETKYWKTKWEKRPLEGPNNFAKKSFLIMKNLPSKTLLDLGCGDGRDSHYFAGKGFKVTAVDFSDSGIKKLKERAGESGIKDITVIKEDIRNLRLKEDSFSVIYAHLSLHYFDDKETSKIFAKLFRLLKKRGMIFIKCKSIDDSLYRKGKKAGEDMYVKGHVRHFFSKGYMEEKLAGSRVIKIRKSSSVYHGYKSCFIEAVAMK